MGRGKYFPSIHSIFAFCEIRIDDHSFRHWLSTIAMPPERKKQKPSHGKGEARNGGASSSSSGLKVASFHVLPLSLPSTSLQSSPTHYLYLRPHQSSSKSGDSTSLPSGRTLFLVNLPVDTTDRHIRSLFQSAGRIERVDISAVSNLQSAIGIQEDEEEDSEEEDEGDEEFGEDVVGGDSNQPPQRKLSRKEAAKRRAAEEKRPRPPPLVPLPSLDPRCSSSEAASTYPLLATGTSAHVVFLEQGSLEKALSMASGTTKLQWTDPWTEALRRQAKADKKQQRDDDDNDDDDETTKRRKGKPTTALEAAASHLATKDPRPPLGLSYLLASYDAHRPPLPKVKAHADSVVARYTFFRSNPRYVGAEAADAEDLKAATSNVGGIKVASYGPNGEALDEDGFTIVLPGAKYGRALGPEGGIDGSTVKIARRVAPGEEEAALLQRKKKKKDANNLEGLEDFYRFQTRERRKERLAEMRRQFEEDKEKVAKLKEEQLQNGKSAKRRFRPY